jgi:pyrophosphatase PpaX
VPDRWQDCLRLYLQLYERKHRRTGRAFPGIETALGMLRARGVPLAVVTGKGPQSAAISLTQLGLTSFFDFIETGSPEGNVKPHCIQHVLTCWGIAPDQIAYLGDAVSDIEAARAVGLIPLAAAWDGRADPKALLSLAPAAIFDTVEAFVGWIAALEPQVGR